MLNFHSLPPAARQLWEDRTARMYGHANPSKANTAAPKPQPTPPPTSNATQLAQRVTTAR